MATDVTPTKAERSTKVDEVLADAKDVNEEEDDGDEDDEGDGEV